MPHRVRYKVKRKDTGWIVFDTVENSVIQTHKDANEAHAACGSLNYRYKVASRLAPTETRPYPEPD